MGQIHGDLSVMPLADIAIWLSNRGASGLLAVESGALRKDFILRNGMVARASSNDPREYFGQFLVHFGLLTDEQLQRAYQTQSETNVYLGRILVMIGIVGEEQVVQTLRVKISESLLDAFRWRTGRFLFDEVIPEDGRPEIEVAVPMVDIHREGARRSAIWEQFAKIFPHSALLLAVHDSRVPAATSLDTLDGRIVTLARHGLSIEAIGLELHATDYQLAARLFELYRAGVIEPVEPPPLAVMEAAPPVPAQDHRGRAPDPTLPPGTTTHAELARRALRDGDYARAFRHAEASAGQNPGDEELTELARQIEGSYRRDHAAGQISRDVVPAMRRQLDHATVKRLSAKHRYLLARIDGKRSIQAIIQISPMSDLEALDIIMQLRADGIIGF